jgi:iron complex outermembrane receptor protein
LTLQGISFDGNRMISAPRFAETLAADYIVAAFDGYDLLIHVDGNYRTRQWYSAYNGATVAGINYAPISQAGYGLLNGRLALNSDDDRYGIALWGKNILNRKYVSYALPVSATAQNYFLDGAPATFGLQLNCKF